jgi:hypothetical protein
MKFLFIAREGGHPVSPSPIIDKAWHLHLLYTKEYWSDFCPNILGFNLDHSPHTGDPSASDKFANWTDQTLVFSPEERRCGLVIKRSGSFCQHEQMNW